MDGRIHVSDPITDALCEHFIRLTSTLDHTNVALSGGNTPRDFFDLLATTHRDAVPWERVTIYQVDERCVPPDHEDSNWKQIQERLLDRIPNIKAHRMRAEDPAAADHYETLLREKLPTNDNGVPVFDLVLLGLGPDGHTASLFPDTDALTETRRAVVRNWVPQLDTHRVTLTFPVLNAARNRWFMLRGADRKDIFREVRSGLHPAGKIRDPEWFITPDLL